MGLEKFITYAQLFIKQKNKFKFDHKSATEFIDKTFNIMPPPFNFIGILWRIHDDKHDAEKFIAILENLLDNKNEIKNIGNKISNIEINLLSNKDIEKLENMLSKPLQDNTFMDDLILKYVSIIKKNQQDDSKKIEYMTNTLNEIKEKIFKKNPDELLTNTSKIHYDENIKKAMQDYELKNKHMPIKFDVGYIKNNLSVFFQLINYYYYNSRYDEALKYCNTVLDVIQNTAILYNKGLILYQLKKYDVALKSLQTVIKLEPNFSYAHSTLSVTYLQLNKIDDAIYHCELAIKLNPDYSDAYSNKATILASMNKHVEALECIDFAIMQNPQLPMLYVNKSTILTKINNFDESIHYCNVAINIDPTCSDAYYNKGNAFAYCNKYNDAIENFNLAISIEPNVSSIYSDKASALANLNKYDESLDFCNIALQLDPCNVNAMSIMGTIYGEREEFEKSIQYLNKATELNQNHYASHNNKAQIYLKMGNHENALHSVKQAINLQPDKPLAYFTKGDIYLATNKLNEAFNAYKKSINLRINFAPGYFGLAKVSFKMKNYRDVGKYCGTTLQLWPEYPKARPLKAKAIEQYVIETMINEYGYDKKLIRTKEIIKNKNNCISPDIIGYSVKDNKKIQFIIEFKNYIDNINKNTKYLIDELKPDFIILWKNYDTYKIYKLINGKTVSIEHIPKLNENIHVGTIMTQPLIKFQRIINQFRNAGINSDDYVIDLAKIIACKIYDETNKTNIFINFTTNYKNNICELEHIWENISDKYPKFKYRDKFSNNPEIITHVCNELKNFSFIKTGKHEICTGYLSAIDSYHDLTLSLILETTVQLLQIKNNKKIIYPFCNFGHELLTIHKTFNSTVVTNNKNLTYYGIEPNRTKSAIASFIFTVLDIENIILTEYPLSSKPHDLFGSYDYAIISLLFGKMNPELSSQFDKIDLGNDVLSYMLNLILQHINYNGKIGLIAPHNFLNANKYKKIREFIINGYNINAIISVPNHNIKSFSFPICIIIIEKNKILTYSKIFVSHIENMLKTHRIYETSKLNRVFKKLILGFNLFKLTNKIYEQSDEIFFIDKSDLKDDWSIQHLTPSSIAMINQLSHKMLLCDISNIIPGNLILKTNNSIDGIPYIRISDITNGVLDVNNSIRINATHAKSNNATIIHANDVLLSRQGTIGKTCVVPKHLHGCYLSPQLVIIRINRNDVDPEFIKYQIMNSSIIKRQFQNYRRGSFIQAISISDLNNIYVSVPSPDTQKQYLLKSNELRIYEHNLKEKSEQIKSEMDGLL